MCSFLLCVDAGIFLWILTVLWEDFSPSSSPLPLHCQCWGRQRLLLHQLRCSGSLHFSGRRGWSCVCHELPSAQSSTLRVFCFMSYLYCSKFWKVKHNDVRSGLDFPGLPQTFCAVGSRVSEHVPPDRSDHLTVWSRAWHSPRCIHFFSSRFIVIQM